MAKFGAANQLIHSENGFNQASSSSDAGFDMSQLSTRKADRVAMLKTRFADIISKAQQTLGNNEGREDQAKKRPENVDFAENQQKKKRRIESEVTNSNTTTITNKDRINQARMQHEKKDFKEKQQAKNRGIIVRAKASEAIRNKTNLKHKRKIEKEREAARRALEKVEASVYVDDFYKTYKEFMMLVSSKCD